MSQNVTTFMLLMMLTMSVLPAIPFNLVFLEGGLLLRQSSTTLYVHEITSNAAVTLVHSEIF